MTLTDCIAIKYNEHYLNKILNKSKEFNDSELARLQKEGEEKKNEIERVQKELADDLRNNTKEINKYKQTISSGDSSLQADSNGPSERQINNAKQYLQESEEKEQQLRYEAKQKIEILSMKKLTTRIFSTLCIIQLKILFLIHMSF